MSDFIITLPHIELSVDEVWPDNDAPENATAEDVVKAMEAYGSVERVLGDWNLLTEGLDVFGVRDRSRATFR